jgi:predicted site-specific integrase-resolvase
MTRRVLLKPAAVAAQLGVTTKTLARWRVSGKGPRFVKLQSGGIRYDAKDIEDEIAARVRCSTSDAGEDRAATAAR